MRRLPSALSALSRAAASVYYRVRYTGAPVPRTGPVLLVANHANSLLDPMLVLAAARRTVRFLAKAPLFADPRTAWLVRAAGAIPVHRPSDDPAQVGRNVEAFAAVHAALGRGAAVGIFPEGRSHSEPSLAPLRTGAARMALGAARDAGGAFPIVPVGLVFDRKEEFRSSALVLTGPPVAWSDLAGRGAEDAGAVRELTERVSAGLAAVTVNLEAWADRPLVECAVRIWEAEHGAAPAAEARVARVERTTRVLRDVRASGDRDGLALAGDLDRFRRRLERLGLRPADVGAEIGAGRAVGWAAGKLHILAPPALAVALAGFVAFYPPYRLTGSIVGRVRLEPDERSTWKLLVGIGVYGAWVVAIAAAAGAWAATTAEPGRRGVRAAGAAVGVLIGLPALGMVGLVVRERWRDAWQDARRFLRLRGRRALVAQLREERRALGARIDALLRDRAPRSRPEPVGR